jgi:hypothetical protein
MKWLALAGLPRVLAESDADPPKLIRQAGVGLAGATPERRREPVRGIARALSR